MSKIRILVTGATGQLGQELQRLAQNRTEAEWHFYRRDELDITNAETLRQVFEIVQPNYCINAAAFTAVDAAESDPEKAFLVNAHSMEGLAASCKAHQTCLFYISTDYVYHGDQNRPYREEDPPSPKNVYARSKRLGEEIALREHPATYVLRTSWLYSSFGNNFVKTMLRLGQERDKLGVVRDQIGSPTYARDLALVIWRFIEQQQQGKGPAYGIYNYSNAGVASWYDFAHAIFELAGETIDLRAIPTTDFPTPALRPPFSLMDLSKLQKALQYRSPHWRDSLRRCLRTLDSLKN